MSSDPGPFLLDITCGHLSCSLLFTEECLASPFFPFYSVVIIGSFSIYVDDHSQYWSFTSLSLVISSFPLQLLSLVSNYVIASNYIASKIFIVRLGL